MIGLKRRRVLSPRALLPDQAGRTRAVLAIAAIAFGLIPYLTTAASNSAATAPTPAPTQIADAHLVGDRGPACITVVAARDDSSSVAPFAPSIAAASSSLLDWAPRNLRATDRIVVIDFATTAQVRLDSNVKPGIKPSATTPIGSDTSAAALLASITGLPNTPCKITAFVLGDGEFGDQPDPVATEEQLRAAGVEKVVLLSPTGDNPPAYRTVFPYGRVRSVDLANPDELALVFADEIAAATGQTLE